MFTAPACPHPVSTTRPRSRTWTTSAWSSRIIGSGSQPCPRSASWKGIPVSKSVVRSTSPVISTLPSSSNDGWRRSMTSKPSASSERRLSTGSSQSGRPGNTTRRLVHTSGCKVIGTPWRRRRWARPGKPPAWSKWPWLSTTASIVLASMPSRSRLSARPFGDTPVSNSRVWISSPRRVVTSAAKPCSATRPGTVTPCSNCGAGTRGVWPIAIRRAGPMSASNPS